MTERVTQTYSGPLPSEKEAEVAIHNDRMPRRVHQRRTLNSNKQESGLLGVYAAAHTYICSLVLTFNEFSHEDTYTEVTYLTKLGKRF